LIPQHFIILKCPNIIRRITSKKQRFSSHLERKPQKIPPFFFYLRLADFRRFLHLVLLERLERLPEDPGVLLLAPDDAGQVLYRENVLSSLRLRLRDRCCRRLRLLLRSRAPTATVPKNSQYTVFFLAE
jgi:hypothetical protein